MTGLGAGCDAAAGGDAGAVVTVAGAGVVVGAATTSGASVGVGVGDFMTVRDSHANMKQQRNARTRANLFDTRSIPPVLQAREGHDMPTRIGQGDNGVRPPSSQSTEPSVAGSDTTSTS